MIKGVTAEHARVFAEAVVKASAEWEAMTGEEKGAHYDREAEKLEKAIENLSDRNRCIEPDLRKMVASYRESADYWRNGGKSLKECIK